MLDAQQHDDADDRGDTEQDKGWSLTLRPSGESSPSHSSNNLNCSEGDVEKDRVEGVKAKRVDDQGSEGCDTAAGDSEPVSRLKATFIRSSAYEIEKISANQHQVLMSSRLSVTCSHFHSVDTTPI